MIKHSYSISKKAEADLGDIWLYTFQHWSKEQADRYIDLIFDEIQYLAKKPTTGRTIDYIKEGYRVVKVKSHLLFYKMVDETSIEIIRILHERMDAQRHFEK